MRTSPFFLACVAALTMTVAHAQVEVPQKVIEDAAKEGCDPNSVVVRNCPPPAVNVAPKKGNDALTKSRERAKAAFDRRDRAAQQNATDGKASVKTDAKTDAERLTPVTVTGNASSAPPPTPEAVIQKALNPQEATLENGNSVSYGPNGERTECQAKCVGPACCKVMRPFDPAKQSNSIGR
jgi:hypothetical protein